ncbi:MAG: AbrB/MazE/SpoVT family DNA-binding domain-containing protein [Deltaproteobacteria bacterium]|nr:AbrB/MazE/SpoVT family DNA-binding domain-containing protein [Deltaproteobacteria bacterium]
MVKTLTAIGNSLGLIIDKPILDLLHIDRDTRLEIDTDGEALVIRPVREKHGRRVRGAAKRMMDAHDTALRKLAR